MFIATASTTVKFHDFPNGKVAHHYQPGSKVEGPIRSISWSRDGNWLAVVPSTGNADIVSVKDQLKLVKTIQDVEAPYCAAFLNSTKKLVGIGTKTGEVLIYDIKARSTKKRFPQAGTPVTIIAFTAKDTHCVAGCLNGEILLYSNINNNISSTFRVPRSRTINCLRANQFKRNLIIGGSNEGVVVVWDSNVGKPKFYIDAHKAPVEDVAFSPVNSDLILTTGCDRQFGFYDIIDKKCIASVSVPNSITSVDFSPEGTYFIMGSQNGTVFIYDSRNIQEPVHSFIAHNSTVKHLLFQRCLDKGSTSCTSLSRESLDSGDNIESAQFSGDVSNRDSELFGMFIQVPSTEVVESIKTSGNSVEAEDSFLAALGINKNNTTESLHQEHCTTSDVLKKWGEVRATPPPANPTKTMHDKLGLGDSKQAQMSSTPKFFLPNFNNNISPIRDENQSHANITASELQSVVREAVRDELRSTLEEVKADIKYQSTHITYQIRRMIIDLHMAMIREFIKVENYCNGIKDDIVSDIQGPAESTYLIEENEQLKKKIESLEQQLAYLTASENTQNGQSG